MGDLTKIHALVDGELDGAERAEAEALVQTSPEANAQYVALRMQKAMLAEKAVPMPAPDVWRGCVERLGEIDRSRRVEAFVGRYAWGLCALFFLAIVGGGILNRSGTAGSVTTAEIASLASSLSSQTRPTSHRGAIEQMLGPTPPISLEPERLRVVEVARSQIDGREIGKVTFADEFGHLALIIVPGVRNFQGAERIEGSPYSAGEVGSVPCLVWTHRDFGLMLIGDRRVEELQRVAERISQ